MNSIKKAIPKHSMRPTFAVGSSVIPLRIRLDPFDFGADFSFGTTFGTKFRLSPYNDASIHTVLGLHLTSVSLDSLDTEGAVTSTTTETETALTPLVGLVFGFSSAQIGLYSGWDFIKGEFKDKWIYQGKPWLSIGVGVSLFTAQGSNASPPAENLD